MDALAGLLDGPRARDAFLLRAILAPPWSLRIQDQAPLTVIAQVHGSAWVLPDDGRRVPLAPGEVAVVCGPAPYSVADDPGTAPQVIIHPGQRCETPDGQPAYRELDLGVRTWGNSAAGDTVMLVGSYHLDGEVSLRLLRALPKVLVLPAPDGSLISLLSKEIVRDEPGQEVVLDRLLDLLLITTLRTWFARPEAGAPGWYRAQGDPVIGRALRMLHNNPAHPWTVAALASATGVSRATLARRFTELVGEPPMSFLAGWRLALAADLLRATDATVSSVAASVGYGSPFALSAAFKRAHGRSPQQYRTRVLN
ncbi:MAG TPA: AraC family transcriptional regulator [Actinophytocola sp.]|uniref:AraC family transcriptional regulator n=1 Tax=Actinophytocola sp. TaxID=1872138 RepID=UPI002DB7873E|nr:AraC family transcriptional regulator [Actinophytocola sp.]HEU5473746.1 AraC family transcriptional regulator [Actinophytocola sp.]